MPVCSKHDLPVAIVLALQARSTGRFFTVEELVTNEFVWKFAGMIGLLSGKLKPGEKSVNAMIREAREEAGINLKPRAIRVLSKSYRFKQHDVPVTMGHVWFEEEFEGFSIDKEVRPNGWMTEEELLALRWQELQTRVETHTVIGAVRAARGVLI